MGYTLGIVEIDSHQESTTRQTVQDPMAGRHFANTSLLEWVVRRATEAQCLDRVIVLCSDQADRQSISRWTPSDVEVFTGSGGDRPSRFVAAAKNYGADAVVRMRVDNPFVDPVLIDRLVNSAQSHAGCDYVGFFSTKGRATMLARLGVLAEWCRIEAIVQADQQAGDAEQSVDPMDYVLSHPERFQLKFIPLPRQLDRRDVRLAIRSEKDWEHARDIFEALGAEDLEWQRIVEFLHHHPDIRKQMAELNRIEVGC